MATTTPSDDVAAAEKVRQLRVHLGWTLTEAARRTEIKPITLRRLERHGRGRRYATYLQKLEEARAGRRGGSDIPSGDAATAVLDLVVKASGASTASPLAVELAARMRDMSPAEKATILEAIALGIRLATESQPREKAK